MPASLRALLAEPRFHLTPVTPMADEVLDAPLISAHSSDLPDPTPWLEPDQLLLTDGVQFVAGSTFADEYVSRLRRRGIVALGFATRIVHDEIPDELIAACRESGLPLLEVADRTPFMALIKFVSDAVASDQRERLEASLSALRAVARAALRPDGLTAILRELEKNLDSWVVLYDAAGSRVEIPTRIPMPDMADALVVEAVRRALMAGRPAGLRLTLPDLGEVTLQTLGHTDRLRGILVVGVGAKLDRAGNDLVQSVIALASIALEQSRAVDDARRRLRTGILELLHAGVLDVAGGAVRPLWGDLPSEPIRVGIADTPDGPSDGLMAALELLAERHSGSVFFAERDRRLVVVVPGDDREPVEKVLASFGAGAGFSAPATWAGFRAAEEESRRAASRLTADSRFVVFESLAEAGLLGHLEVTGARAVARRILQPLIDDDTANGGSLVETLSVWLENNCAGEPAARALGIHRHTLKTRVETAGSILRLDLASFGARAEVWNALQLVHQPH